MNPTDLLADFAQEGVRIRATITYLEATNQDTSQLKTLHATWQRATAALIIFNAKPDEAANERFLLDALTDIMTIIDTMLPEPQTKLPPRVD